MTSRPDLQHAPTQVQDMSAGRQAANNRSQAQLEVVENGPERISFPTPLYSVDDQSARAAEVPEYVADCACSYTRNSDCDGFGHRSLAALQQFLVKGFAHDHPAMPVPSFVPREKFH